MLKRPVTVITLILLVVLAFLAVLYIAHGRIASASSKDLPEALFWMEVTKPVLQMLYVALGGGIIAGFLRILFDSVQTRRQVDAAKDQFRREVITGFIDARYEATAWREKFLNAPAAKLEEALSIDDGGLHRHQRKAFAGVA